MQVYFIKIKPFPSNMWQDYLSGTIKCSTHIYFCCATWRSSWSPLCSHRTTRRVARQMFNILQCFLRASETLLSCYVSSNNIHQSSFKTLINFSCSFVWFMFIWQSMQPDIFIKFEIQLFSFKHKTTNKHVSCFA